MNHPISDAGIPLLTEIITPAAPSPLLRQPETGESASQSGEPDAAGVVLPPVDAQEPGIPGSPLPNGETEHPPQSRNWDRLERELRERITVSLRTKIDKVVEQRMEEALADLLQIAVDSITSEIRQSLHQAISDTVSEAIKSEISLLKQTE